MHKNKQTFFKIPVVQKGWQLGTRPAGIGAAIVRRFHNDGCTVIIADICAEAGGAMATSLGERAIFMHCDVTCGSWRAEPLGLSLYASGYDSKQLSWILYDISSSLCIAASPSFLSLWAGQLAKCIHALCTFAFSSRIDVTTFYTKGILSKYTASNYWRMFYCVLFCKASKVLQGKFIIVSSLLWAHSSHVGINYCTVWRPLLAAIPHSALEIVYLKAQRSNSNPKTFPCRFQLHIWTAAMQIRRPRTAAMTDTA